MIVFCSGDSVYMLASAVSSKILQSIAEAENLNFIVRALFSVTWTELIYWKKLFAVSIVVTKILRCIINTFFFSLLFIFRLRSYCGSFPLSVTAVLEYLVCFRKLWQDLNGWETKQQNLKLMAKQFYLHLKKL